MRRSTLMLLLTLLAMPAWSPADHWPSEHVEYARWFADYTLKKAGFTQLAPPPTRIGVAPLNLTANLDGRFGEEIFTIEGTDSSYDLITLTPRHDGMPLWSRITDRNAWLRLVPDVNGDGAEDVLIRERRHHEVQAFERVDVIEHRIEMVSGRTGEALWSVVRPIVDVLLSSVSTDLPEPFPMLDATGDGVADVLLITVGAAQEPEGILARRARTSACVADGKTGAVATRCLVVDSTNGYGATILPVPDATGDGRPDLLAYAEVDHRPRLTLNETNGTSVWATYPVDGRYMSRQPSIDYRAGTQPGRVLLAPACSMTSCVTDATDAFDARTGRYLWHVHGGGAYIGDVDGDGGSDLKGRVSGHDGSSSAAVISSATGSTLYVPTTPALPALEGYREPTGQAHVVDDFDGDGILDSVTTWAYNPAPSSGKQRTYIAVATRGRDGAEMWRQFVGGEPAAYDGDADGGGTRDLRATYTTIPIHGSGFDLREGSTFARRWTVGPFTGRQYTRPPIAADVDGAAGEELILSWTVDDGSEKTDDVDYLAAYGPAGRIWGVAITLEGTSKVA